MQKSDVFDIDYQNNKKKKKKKLNVNKGGS